MLQMKRNCRESKRLRVDLDIGQSCGPLGEVIEGQIKRMENSAAHGRNVGVGAAQPGLNVRRRCRSAHGEVLILRLGRGSLMPQPFGGSSAKAQARSLELQY